MQSSMSSPGEHRREISYMDERDYWLAFSLVSGVGPKKFALLLDAFRSAERAWGADDDSLTKTLGPALTAKLLSFKQTFNYKQYKELLEKKQIWFVILDDSEYPELLKQIVNPPFVLFGKGDKDLLIPQDSTLVAIVGTRKMTQYGRQVTEMITKELVAAGCIIVSGLALGVDATTHRVTVENVGKTIAVLGCGVDCCYPSTNQSIYDSILSSGGAIISESPPSMQPSIGSFPSRNRIIAGMCTATVVTEGAEDSGSLITAENALSYGRKVFAIPGPITSQLSNGPMKLIRKGAVLVTSGEDILKELQVAHRKTASVSIKGDNSEEQEIIDLLKNESLHFDELVKKTGGDAQKVGSLVSVMEIKGYITQSISGIISLAE